MGGPRDASLTRAWVIEGLAAPRSEPLCRGRLLVYALTRRRQGRIGGPEELRQRDLRDAWVDEAHRVSLGEHGDVLLLDRLVVEAVLLHVSHVRTSVRRRRSVRAVVVSLTASPAEQPPRVGPACAFACASGRRRHARAPCADRSARGPRACPRARSSPARAAGPDRRAACAPSRPRAARRAARRRRVARRPTRPAGCTPPDSAPAARLPRRAHSPRRPREGGSRG